MYIYIFKDDKNSYIELTDDRHIKDLAKFRKGESWLKLGCTVYISEYIDKKFQKNISSILRFYEDKYIKEIEPDTIPVGIDKIRIGIKRYDISLIKPVWDFNPAEDIWLKSQEIFHEKESGTSMAYKVDSFLTKDRTQFYNVLYNIGYGTYVTNLNESDFIRESFSKHMNYTVNWALLYYHDLNTTDDFQEKSIKFGLHQDTIHINEKDKIKPIDNSAQQKFWEENNSINLKYFDDTSECNAMNKHIEDLWIKTMKNYDPGDTIWDLDTIIELVESLQQYFYTGEQKKWFIDNRKLRDIIDHLARVTLTLGNIAKGEIEPDSGHRDYMSKKLAYVFTVIDKNLCYW
jgi:hypothetical protein